MVSRPALAKPIGWAGLTAAFVIAVAGFPRASHPAADPDASFRCPPPLVSAWTRTMALEKEHPRNGAPDAEVQVNCQGWGESRLTWALSLGVLGAVAVTADGDWWTRA
jgi:hypothetical protein